MKTIQETDLIGTLREQIKGVYASKVILNEIENTIQEIAKLEDIDPSFTDLLEDVIRLGGVGKRDFFHDVGLICDKIDDSQVDYEGLLQQYPPHMGYYADAKVTFLVKRTNKISSLEKVKELLHHFSYSHSYGFRISEIITKSTHKIDNLEELLKVDRFLYDEAFSAEDFFVILNNMDAAVDDEKVAKTIILSAVRAGNIELLDLLKEKSSIEIDISSVLLHAIKVNDKGLIYALLDLGANVNYVGLDSNGNKFHVLDLVCSEFKGEQKEALINDLLNRGADLSLMRGKYNQSTVIDTLHKQSNYKKLEEYLPQLTSNIVSCGFDKDDAQIIKMAMEKGLLDVNAKNDISYYVYGTLGGQNESRLILPFALTYGKRNIATFLIEEKAEIGDFPIFEHVMRTKNNSALQALCNNGYDINQKILQPYLPDKKIHLLEYALFDKNADASKILLENMNARDINGLNESLLGYLLGSNLDKAVKEELFQTIRGKGLALKIDPEKNSYFLRSACTSGTAEIAKYLHEVGYDINEKFDKYEKGDKRGCCLNEAIEKGEDDIVEYLLQNNVEVDGETLLLAVAKNTRIDLLQTIIETTSNLNATNMFRQNALHYAAKSGNKEAFELLVEKGFNPLTCDIQGNNTYCLAIYHDKNEALGFTADKVPFDIDAFKNNLKFIKYASTEVNEAKSTYAAKFSCLFDNADQLQIYFSSYKSRSYQVDHDLAQFSFPQNKNFTKEVWRGFAMKHGLEVTKHLFLAETIEENLGRPPESFDEIKSQARSIKYPRASESPEMADLFHENTISENVFNIILDSYRPKTEDYIPDILIEGSTFGQDRFYMKKLSSDDLRGFILGNKTNCCQYVGAGGNDCAQHGMTSPNGGFYVVFKRDKAGRVNNLENWLENLGTSPREEYFITSLQDKATRKKYQGIISDIKEDLRNQNIADDFEQVKNILLKGLEKELEGEIVAQSWVWLSKDNNLVLDSWERLREDDDILLKPFMRALSQEVLSVEGDIKKVLIGNGGYTPKEFALATTQNPEIPRDYNGYRDSKDQFLIATKKENEPIKFNDALGIDDSRMKALKDNFLECKDQYQYESIDKNKTNLDILKRSQKNWRDRHQDRSQNNSDLGR